MRPYDYDPDDPRAPLRYAFDVAGSSITYQGDRPAGLTDARYDAPKVGNRSPWGAVQGTRPFLFPSADLDSLTLDRVVFVSTARHGGIWLAPDVAHAMPGWAQRFASAWSHGWGPQWYEEDTAAPLAVLAHPRLVEQSPMLGRGWREFADMFQKLPTIARLPADARDQIEEWLRSRGESYEQHMRELDAPSARATP